MNIKQKGIKILSLMLFGALVFGYSQIKGMDSGDRLIESFFILQEELQKETINNEKVLKAIKYLSMQVSEEYSPSNPDDVISLAIKMVSKLDKKLKIKLLELAVNSNFSEFGIRMETTTACPSKLLHFLAQFGAPEFIEAVLANFNPKERFYLLMSRDNNDLTPLDYASYYMDYARAIKIQKKVFKALLTGIETDDLLKLIEKLSLSFEKEKLKKMVYQGVFKTIESPFKKNLILPKSFEHSDVAFKFENE